VPKLLLVLLLLKEEEGGAEVLVRIAIVAHRPVNLHKRGHNHTEATRGLQRDVVYLG
jgi:hypothetical protein